MKDLTTIEGRKAAVAEIEQQFISELKKYHYDIAPNAVCQISDTSIKIGIKPQKEKEDIGYLIAFGSEVDFYTSRNNRLNQREFEVNFGTSGCFNPSNESSYWRVLHAASLLKKWETSCKLVEQYCKKYQDLVNEIHSKNNLK